LHGIFCANDIRFLSSVHCAVDDHVMAYPLLAKQRDERRAAVQLPVAPHTIRVPAAQASVTIAGVKDTGPVEPVPLTYSQAMRSANNRDWNEAMHAEKASLTVNGTFEYVPMSEVIKSKHRILHSR
jgi:hypothetical protein